MRTLILAAAGVAIVALAACSKPAPKAYENPDWEFGATFVGAVKTTDTPASADGSQPHSFLAASDAGGGHDFAVDVTDASQSSATGDDMLNNAPAAVGNAQGLDVGATRDVAIGTRTGREVRFDKDGKPVMLMRFFFAYQKFYEVSATVPNGLADPQSAAFLNSFHLLRRGGGEPAPAPPANAAAANTAPANAAG